MSNTTIPARAASCASKSSNPDRRHRADFARATVFAEFGRHAFAIDQGDFVDRKPAERCGILFVGSRSDGT